MSEITVEAPGAELSALVRGRGPGVVLVHGLGADGSVWAPVAAALDAEATVVTYDRRGYGASGRPAPYGSTSAAEQAEDLMAVIAATLPEAPVVGAAEIGALACLDVIVRHPGLIRAAVLVDPPLFALVPTATEALAAERAGLEAALARGGPEEAVQQWLGTRGAGPEQIARARPAAVAFFADYAGLASWPVSRRTLRELDVPLAVLSSAGAPAHVRAAADALGALIPGARREHRGDVASALRALVAA